MTDDEMRAIVRAQIWNDPEPLPPWQGPAPAEADAPEPGPPVDPVSMLEVLQQAREKARDTAVAARTMAAPLALRALLDGHPATELAEVLGFQDARQQRRAIQFHVAMGLTPPDEDGPTAVEQFAEWLTIELTTFIRDGEFT